MLTFLRLVLLDFFDVFPPNGRFVLAVILNAKLTTETGFVIYDEDEKKNIILQRYFLLHSKYLEIGPKIY